jgi:hypothetical protein
METSLHRALKVHYASSKAQTEIRVDSFRIDAIDKQGRLVEVQHAGLGSIRSKIARLLQDHPVRVIKPLVRSKCIRRLDPLSGQVLSRRRSPKQAGPLDVFSEMLHFTTVFPHPRLQLEIPLVDVEEDRVDRPHRYRRKRQYRVLDQKLLGIHEIMVLSTAEDLWRLTGNPSLPGTFDTRQLAETIGRPRWFAQQVAYVLQRCGTIQVMGKSGNSKLYKYLAPRRPPSIGKRPTSKCPTSKRPAA